MEDVANFATGYINYARHRASKGNYSEAYDIFIAAFEKCPGIKSIFEPEFQAVLFKLNKILASAGKVENIFNNLERATTLFPDNIYILNEIGKYLYQCSFYTEACCHFQKALKIDLGFVLAEKNLNSVKDLLVERWHYRMLNDKIRNEAYQKAIHSVVIPHEDTVLDVGTGSGLLSIFANECMPRVLTACDGSETMAKLAECVLQENLVQDVVVHKTMSTNLNQNDIDGKCSVLLTETFDAGLFGEHVLQTLVHAWENLIIDGGTVIPNKAVFYLAAANSDHFAMRFRLGKFAKEFLNMPTINAHVETSDETYDCDDVHLMKDLKFLSDPHSLLTVNFNDKNDLQEKLKRTKPYSIEFKIKEDGEMNIVIGWFNLNLAEKVSITTDPRDKNKADAWQQAVFIDFLPKTLIVDQTVNFKFSLNGGKLAMVNNDHNEIIKISPDTLRFLNDADFIKVIKNCLGMVSIYLGQISVFSEICIVDLCPFPVFGLSMLQRGANSLVCAAKTEIDKVFFEKVFKANSISLSKVSILVGNDWNKDVFGKKKFHAVFCHLFELCGDIDIRMKKMAQYLRYAHLHQNGLFIPNKVELVGQVVDSHWLDINNRVYDTNVSNYKIARFMNQYQVSQNFCLDFSKLEYTALSEPTILGVVGPINIMKPDILYVPVTKNGEGSAILYWFNIELFEALGGISTKRENSFIDGCAFLASPKVPMYCGEHVNIIRCVDQDGSFKLLLDNENR